MLKLMLERFCNRQQFKEDEHEDSFLTSLSNYLRKKGIQDKGSDKSTMKGKILSHVTAS